MIQTFSPAILKALRPEIEAALAEVAARHGITFRAGSGTYGPHEASFKLEMKAPGAADAERARLAMCCESYGLDPDKVSVDGFKLVGFDAKRRTRPFLAEKGGKTYVLDLAGAKLRFAKAA